MQIPYCDASGAIFFIYTNGSLNSSIVGRYVGASCKPCGRIFLVVSLLAVGWPRRSTLDRSSGADFMALRCTGAGAAPPPPPWPFAAPFARVEAALLLVAALAGEARAADEPPLVVGTCTIFMQSLGRVVGGLGSESRVSVFWSESWFISTALERFEVEGMGLLGGCGRWAGWG